ncbi:hypothetical protein AVEN_269844-1 [Araneus ventricosus]|uniref:Uncharacterized protein n=1 Tax=Araneus ventricosus TaxID=182803 RepID=A0A4Y2CET7_ARAVE|nr:hypothetical protein AVEN_269844-1 [Araneus ventricosus]
MKKTKEKKLKNASVKKKFKFRKEYAKKKLNEENKNMSNGNVKKKYEERKRKEEYEERKRKEEYEERKRKDEKQFELQKLRLEAEGRFTNSVANQNVNSTQPCPSDDKTNWLRIVRNNVYTYGFALYIMNFNIASILPINVTAGNLRFRSQFKFLGN